MTFLLSDYRTRYPYGMGIEDRILPGTPSREDDIEPTYVGPLTDGCPLCGSDASVFDDNGHITASCDAGCGWEHQ